MPTKNLNDLFDYGLKIYQDDDNFKFSLDSILLAEYVKLNNNVKNILDIGCGNAAIPLILATKTKASIDAFEIQKHIYDLAVESVNYNHLDSQISIFNEDIKDHQKIIKNKKYDIITCNPPYFKVTTGKYLNNSASLSIARHELKITLEEVMQIASNHLNTKGEFYLVHRSNRLDDIIINANLNKIPVKNIALISTVDNNEPYLVLVRCVKDALPGVKIKNYLCLKNLKTYQGMFKE